MLITSYADKLYCDGRACSIPEGTHFYGDPNTALLIEGLVGAKGKAVRTKGGTFYRLSPKTVVCPGSSIGWEASTGEKLSDAMQWFKEASHKCGFLGAENASKIAGKIIGRPPFTVFSEGQKDFFAKSIYQGPVWAAYASSENATAIDRRGAFLQSFNSLMPAGEPREWMCIEPCDYDDILALDGAAEVTVNVNRYSDDTRSMYPVLPLRLPDCTVCPTGRFTAVVNIALLREAIMEYGVELEEIHRAITFDSFDRWYLKRIYRDVCAIQDKRLRKTVYTRLWGKLAATGALEGYHKPQSDRGERVWITNSNLCWYRGADNSKSPVYRPDIASWITAHNSVEMALEARRIQLADCKIIAAHVDCFWLEGRYQHREETWSIKDTGCLRFFAAGTYAHGKTKGNMIPYPHKDESRYWIGDPRSNSDAYSVPWHF